MSRVYSTSCLFLLLLLNVAEIIGIPLNGSLKWLGSGNQNSERGFDPERDSIQVAVKIVTEHPEIVVQKDPISLNQSERTFYPLKISQGRHSLPGVYSASPRRKEMSTRTRSSGTCAEDIPEWNIYHRVYNETRKCYIPGKGESPCPGNMQFYLIEGDSTYGECDCKIYTGSTYRPLIYWAPANNCFHLFDKGPCDDGEWLNFNSDGSSSVCEKTICPESIDESKSWFQLNSTCHQLSTRAFCTNENQTVHYGVNELEPTCFDSPVKTKKTHLNDALTLPCKRGHKNYGSKECKGTI